jgi:cell division protein FtsB
MKDKILVSTVIITLSLMVIFMLICVKEQSFFAKHAIALISKTSESLKEAQAEIRFLKNENIRLSDKVVKIQQGLNN